MNYAAALNNTPQTKPLANHPNMVKNNAGGYVFKTNFQQNLERFLLLGSEENTYYADKQTLTEDNARSIIEYIKSSPACATQVLDTVRSFITENKAPKIDPALFVLTLVCTYAPPSVKNGAYQSIQTLCKTATHLFIFVSQVNELRGWSSGLRKGVAKWYTSKLDDKLAYQLVKYRNRAGFTHKDVLRLAHPKALTTTQNTLFQYAVDKFEGNLGINLIYGFEEVKKNNDINTTVWWIQKAGLTWEMIPTQFLNEPKVLEALLENMPTTAMLRNLNRFAKAGLTNGLSNTTKKILSKLEKHHIINSGIHPVNLINTTRTYASGRGDKWDNNWNVNQNIVDALNEACYHAIHNVIPTGKSILVALDVSGSMNSMVTKTNMTASQLGAVLAVTMAKVEPLCEIIGFSTHKVDIPIGKRTTIESASKCSFHGGGTDCAVAFSHALSTGNKYDAIIILTDNETWAGPKHGITLLSEYRKKINKDVKVIEVAMVSNSYTSLPENDPNVLRTVGFDNSLVQVISEFIK